MIQYYYSNTNINPADNYRSCAFEVEGEVGVSREGRPPGA